MNPPVSSQHITATRPQERTPGPPRILIVLAVFAACGMIFSLAMLMRGPGPGQAGALGTTPEAPAMIGAAGSVESQGPPPEALALLQIPEFTMRDQNGREHTRDIFKGNWTIMAFSFTNCPTACPIMHSHLIRAQELLKGTPVKIVTISVDPENDTPEVMKAYAQRVTADESRWTFLSGDVTTMRRVVEGLKFALRDDPSIIVTLPDGRTMPNILHPTQFIIVSPDVKIVALESGTQVDSAERVEAKVRRLIKASTP